MLNPGFLLIPQGSSDAQEVNMNLDTGLALLPLTDIFNNTCSYPTI